MIKVCENGHVTGQRTCHCGARTEPQQYPFTELVAVRNAREQREQEVRISRARVCGVSTVEMRRREAQSIRDKALVLRGPQALVKFDGGIGEFKG